jgi:hypothetical protein
MKTQFTHPRLLAVAATAVLLAAFAQNGLAGGWIPMRIQGTATIQSVVPTGGDGQTVTADVVLTEAGESNIWGQHTSIWYLVVEFDAATFAPIRASGEIVQTNTDGSTLTFQTRAEGDRGFTMITGGTGRFEHAIGGSFGKTVQNEDGTFSYKERGWITGIERRPDNGYGPESDEAE